jgi:phytoene/squalene synthetase
VSRSLREAARELAVPRAWLKGFCEGRRIPLTRAGRTLVLSQRGFEQVQRYVSERAAA